MNAQGERRSQIKTLAMTGEGGDLLSSRLRVEQLFGALDLHPASLPPSAILCLRHLRDPRPGLLRLDAPALRPSPRWEEALGAAIEAAARRAARPAHEAVGASADAVLFSDRSELLACLARDALRGALGARWWWRSLLPSVAGERVAFEAWLAAPEHVPGALQLLGERGEASAFVRALAPAELRALARAVGERFGARALLAVATMPRGDAGERDAPRVHAQVESSVNAAWPAPPRRAAEPWRPWTPELLAERLDDLPRAFLGVALALHRAPAAARSLSFAGAIQRWIDGDAREERAPEAPPPPSTGALSPTATNDADAPTAERDRRSTPVLEGVLTLPATPIPAAAPTHERPLDRAPADAPSPTALAAPSALRDEPPSALAAVDAPAPPLSSPVETPAPIATSASPAAPSPPAGEAPRLLPPPPPIEPLASFAPPLRAWGAPQRTAFGGVFFLINLGQNLELYGDFSTPLTPGIDLPLWDFLALVGRDLVGPALEDDAVWPLLAALSGRDPGAPPGQGFSPAPSWQIPPRWLLPFAADPAALARFSAEAPPPAPGSAPLDRWLGLVLPYVRARLARALGALEEEAGRLTCALPARIQLTATHLDLTLSLADLPIELRLAGLDRDPGWVPAAGRYIAFHFG